MPECPRCGSYVRHEHAAHECDVLHDRYEGIQPWYGMADAAEEMDASKDTNPKEGPNDPTTPPSPPCQSPSRPQGMG